MVYLDKKYKTRRGEAVRILCIDSKGEYSVVGLILGVKYDSVRTWTSEGLTKSGCECEDDLILISPIQERIDFLEKEKQQKIKEIESAYEALKLGAITVDIASVFFKKR